MARSQAEILGEAYRVGTNVSILELAAAFGLDMADGVLALVPVLRTTLEEHKLELVPDLSKGDFDEKRTLVSRTDFNEMLLKLALEQEEGHRIEYKSTLMYDIKRAEHNPDATVEELRSDDVIFATLKTIDGFLNCEGGTLYLGVDDRGKIVGFDRDYVVLPAEQRNPDRWQLRLRELIERRFHDGKAINDYVDVQCVEIAELGAVARVAVHRRARLSVLKNDGEDMVFRRQGNRTVRVTMPEIEEFVLARGS